MPGHGQSSKDLDRPFDADRVIGDVQALVEAEDLSDLTVIGESIGGTTALALGARIPERLTAVAAFNPHDGMPMLGGWRGKSLSRIGRYTSRPFTTETADILRGVLSAAFYDPERLPDDYLAVLVESGKDPAYPKVMKSVMTHQASWPAVRSLYGEIPAELPVLLAYGDHDWASDAAKQANAERIASVDDYVSMDQCGHWSFLESPERVVELVLELS